MKLASTSRYYPKGYIGSEQAAVLLARLRCPENWRPETILEAEQEIWDGLGSSLNAEVIEPLVWEVLNKLSNVASFDESATLQRYGDFDQAMQDLRSALHAGELRAEFCDERGRVDFIRNEGWGGDEGFDILLRGIVTLEGDLTRVILLSEVAIAKLAALTAEADQRDRAAKSGGKIAPHVSRQAPKNPGRPAGEIFREWREREKAAGRVPTYDEDIAFMKSQGFGRNRVRELRHHYPRLPRGKPRRKSEDKPQG